MTDTGITTRERNWKGFPLDFFPQLEYNEQRLEFANYSSRFVHLHSQKNDDIFFDLLVIHN